LEVENTRTLANVRIHVERVIGLVRQKYAILKGTLPVEYVTKDLIKIALMLIKLFVCVVLFVMCVTHLCLLTN